MSQQTTDELASALANTLIKDVQNKISGQVAAEVSTHISNIDIPKLVQDLTTELAASVVKGVRVQLSDEIAKKSANIDVTQTVTDTAAEQTVKLIDSLTAQLTKQVQADVAQKIAQVDVQMMLHEYVNSTLGAAIKTVNFPADSIPGTAINVPTLKISGNNVSGGIVTKFGSTGIQDSASHCILTVLDDATVVENNLVAASADIKGNLTVDGDFVLTGDIDPDSTFFKDISERAAGLLRLSLTTELFELFANSVLTKIKTDGINLSKISIDNKEVVNGNQLGMFITDSNLQKVGQLKTLTVVGESTFNNTLFARNKRVGINTEEPAGVLAIWDEEVEVLAKKLRQNTAFIGTPRNQQLVLSANNKDNIVLEVDGSVTIPKLVVGTVLVTSSATEPKHDAPLGTLVINSAPDVGKPAFWQSLGGARWGHTGNLM